MYINPKLILLLFVCLEMVLASVQHSRHEIEPGVFIEYSDGNLAWAPIGPYKPKEPENRYAVIPEKYPQKLIAYSEPVAHCTLMHMREPRVWLIRCEADGIRTYVTPSPKEKQDAIAEAREWLVLHDQQRFIINVKKLRKS